MSWLHPASAVFHRPVHRQHYVHMLIGASIDDFHLGGYTPSAVLTPSRLTFLDKRADLTARILSGAFTLNLGAADAGKAEAFDIIYSQGPLDGSGNLLPHPVRAIGLSCHWLSSADYRPLCSRSVAQQ